MAQKAIDLFQTLRREPTDTILIGLFSACARLKHSRAISIGHEALSKMNSKYSNNVNVLTSALDMYIKSGQMNRAEKIFSKIKPKTVIKYGAMMKGYNMQDEPLKAWNLFKEMQNESIIPNEIIYLLLIDSCSEIGILSRCQRLVEQIPPSMQKIPEIQTGLIDMWVRKYTFVNSFELHAFSRVNVVQ